MDAQSLGDPVEHVYNRRTRGLGVLVAAAGEEMHAHTGCWFLLVAGSPSRLLVSVPNEYPALDLIRASGTFTMSLPAASQQTIAEAIRRDGPAAPVTWWQAPSGGLCLPGATAILDCWFEGSHDLGDSTLVWGRVASAGGRREAVNLTANELGAPDEACALHHPTALRPRGPLAMARLPERAEDAYRRRRLGVMAVVGGDVGRWLGALTTGVMQVAHDPPQFAWLAVRGSRLLERWEPGAPWSAAIATAKLAAFTRLPRQEASDGIRWEGRHAALPGALGHFSGVVSGQWEVGSRVVVLGTVEACRADASDEPNLLRDDVL